MLILRIRIAGIAESRATLLQLRQLRNLGDQPLLRVYSVGAVSPYGQRYDHLVQDERHQAEVHQGRWQTVQDAGERFMPALRAAVTQMVQAIIEGRPPTSLSATAEQIYEWLRDYPPERPGQTYIRTERLKQSWRWEVMA